MGAKTAMSPVQPSRSSRCGQSVGTSRKLPRSAPDDVAVQLVEQLVGALELADALQLGGNHDSG